MATRTPSRPDEGIHGEPEVKPRFTSDQAPTGYDTTPLGNRTDSRGDVAAGKSSDPRGDSLTPQQLKERESSGGEGTGGNVGTGEQSLLDRVAGTEKANREKRIGKKEKTGRLGKLGKRINLKSRRSIATITAIGVLGGGGIFGASFVSGPIQVVQMAKGITTHFDSNEDFANDRTSKVLIYALGGKQVEKGRLGVTSNVAANRFEKRLLNDSGMRPLYDKKTGRLVGFEIVNEDKAEKVLGDLPDQNTRKSKRVETSMGRGAQIDPGNDVRDRNGTKVEFSTDVGDNRVVNLTKLSSFADKRAWIDSVTRATGTNRVASTLGARLLKKRGGISFHTMNKAKSKIDDAYRKRIADKRKTDIENGVVDTEGPNAAQSDKNGDGKPDGVDVGDQQISDDTKNAIKEFKATDVVNVKSLSGGAALVGVLCAARSYGNGLDDFKYTNNVLPMMRLGMDAASKGSQVQAGDDFDIGTLGIFRDYLYDKEKKTSWNQAESIRAKYGKPGGEPLPPEADLGKAGEKPALFKTLDNIAPLAASCSAIDAFMSLPVISSLSGAINGITGAVTDAVANTFTGKSTDELITASMKAIAGKSVDAEAKGATFGALADTGAFLAANDQARSMGGTKLTATQTIELTNLQKEYDEQNQQSKSFAERYLDPYESTSVVGSVVGHAPVSFDQAASMVENPINIIGSVFSSAFANLNPKAKAATAPYNYGVDKFGTSKEVRQNDLFEDPYENGMRTNDRNITLQDDLPRLNDLYGKCFGMRVTADDQTGVHIQTKEMGDPELNIIKVSKDPDCDPEKNNDDRFNQYRMYLGDAYDAVALNCNEGDEQACTELGIGSGSSSSISNSGGSSDGSLAEGNSKDLAKQILDSGKVTGDSRYMDQIKAYSNGDYSCHINPTILQLIATIAETHTIHISSLNRRCTGVLTASGEGSYHYRAEGGHAVDIDIVDGVSATGGTKNDLDLLKEILPSLPSGSGIGQSQCRPSGALKLPTGITQFEDTCNHNHIQVPVK
jgi:hypothetical protein